MIWIIIIAAITALDQVTKYIVIKNIAYGEMIPVIDGFFYLTYHENKGAAWGIFQNGRYFLIAVTVVFSAVMVYYLDKSQNRLLKLSLAFVQGGAAGNFIDRVLKGSVADFLDFRFGSYVFPTFNVADTFITVGTVLLAYYMLFMHKEPVKKAE